MKEIVLQYEKKLIHNICSKLTLELATEKIQEIIEVHLYQAHIVNPGSANFQNYYFKTLNDVQGYSQTNTFFKNFKYQYGLQGIDNGFLTYLENNKEEILKLIKNDDLVILYFKFFKKAKLKWGSGHRFSEQGSFFSKLVHTFNPDNYCALDNPVKEYFDLKKESFFHSFLALSSAYKIWSSENQETLTDVRERFIRQDKNKSIHHTQVTDLKLLDLIFWSKANKLKKDNSKIKKQ